MMDEKVGSINSYNIQETSVYVMGFELIILYKAKNSNTCPNACKQSARRTPSARSTGKLLLKSN